MMYRITFQEFKVHHLPMEKDTRRLLLLSSLLTTTVESVPSLLFTINAFSDNFTSAPSAALTTSKEPGSPSKL